MIEPQKELVQQWTSRAENDLLNVSNNLQAQRVPWDTVCFHCQQAAEKYLKAVLVVHAQEVPRIHDLEKLLDLVQDWVPALKDQREECRWLTVYAVASRYPVEVMHEAPGQDEGFRARDIAQCIRHLCRLHIQESVPDGLDSATPA